MHLANGYVKYSFTVIIVMIETLRERFSCIKHICLLKLAKAFRVNVSAVRDDMATYSMSLIMKEDLLSNIASIMHIFVFFCLDWYRKKWEIESRICEIIN